MSTRFACHDLPPSLVEYAVSSGDDPGAESIEGSSHPRFSSTNWI
jgi:hypothetical protein